MAKFTIMLFLSRQQMLDITTFWTSLKVFGK